MDAADFSPMRAGRLVRVPTGYVAFVPDPLPPPLAASWEIAAEVSDADRAIAHLGGVLSALPDPGVLVAPFIRKEAVLSSRIEGTRASLPDLFAYEVGGSPVAPDVREVANYVRALEHGLSRIETLPLSLRLVRELHAELFHGLPAEHVTPGEFRRSQNWIGPPGSTLANATYVPPPPAEMMDALASFESYIHARSQLPPLVRFGLLHYQFEAIHPFLDGNGRVGRLLVTLLLCVEGHVPAPVPYLSAFIERYRPDYYRLLLGVSQRGEWVPWLQFFLRALATQSRDAAERGSVLLALQAEYTALLATGRGAATMRRAVDLVIRAPVLTVASVQRELRVASRTAQNVLARLVEAGVVEEVTGRQRGRVFLAGRVMEVLDGG